MAPTRILRNIDEVRRSLGVSQDSLSDAAGIPRTTLRRKLKNPGTFTLDEAAGVSLALGIEMSDWLEASA